MDPIDSERLDRTFHALGDSSRRRIWRLLGERPGATTMDLAAAVPGISRWAVMKHLAVLRDAGLVQTLPRGRQRCHYRVDAELAGARSWLASDAEAGT
jgi:predicted transcriptional regulator